MVDPAEMRMFPERFTVPPGRTALATRMPAGSRVVTAVPLVEITAPGSSVTLTRVTSLPEPAKLPVLLPDIEIEPPGATIDPARSAV
jgi:hypothetical protein